MLFDRPMGRLLTTLGRTVLLFSVLVMLTLAGCGKQADLDSGESVATSPDTQSSSTGEVEAEGATTPSVPAMSVPEVVDATTAAIDQFNQGAGVTPIPKMFGTDVFAYVNNGFESSPVVQQARGDVFAAVGILAQAELSRDGAFPDYWYNMVSIPDQQKLYVDGVLRPLEEANRSGDFAQVMADLDAYAGRGDDHFRNVEITMAYHMMRNQPSAKATDAFVRVKGYYDTLWNNYYEGTLID